MYVGINGIHSTAITSEELGFIFHGTKRKNQDFLFLFIQGYKGIKHGLSFSLRQILWKL